MTASAGAELARVLEGGPPTGGWFLHGDAARLRDEAASRIVDAALDPATRDFNYDQFRADEVSGEELASALASPPMMAERRVVCLRDAEKLAPGARKLLTDAAARLPSDLVLVITATIPRGSRAAFYRELKKSCRTLEWSAPRAAEIPGWVRERGRTRWGLDLTPAAAQALAAAVGDDLSRLDVELEKLAGLGEAELGPERIAELVPRSRRIDRWSWLDLVAARSYREALARLDDVLGSESGVGLVAGLVEHHLLLGLAVEGGTRLVRQALSEAGRGYLSWKADTYAKQGRAWSADGIDQALRRLHRADGWLKSGGGDRAVLTELLLALEGDRRGVT